MYVYEAHARNNKLRIETVKSDDGITIPLERFLETIDEETCWSRSHTADSKVVSCKKLKRHRTRSE